MSRGYCEPIIRLDDCTVYRSIGKAATAIGVSTSSIKRAIDGKRKCRGWQFAILPEQFRGFGVEESAVVVWAASELLRRSINQSINQNQGG